MAEGNELATQNIWIMLGIGLGGIALGVTATLVAPKIKKALSKDSPKDSSKKTT